MLDNNCDINQESKEKQKQLEALTAPSFDQVPGGQPAHEISPACAPNVPAGQGRQLKTPEPPGYFGAPYDPMGQGIGRQYVESSAAAA